MEFLLQIIENNDKENAVIVKIICLWSSRATLISFLRLIKSPNARKKGRSLTLDHDKELIFTREFHMPESVNQEIELVERLQKRERKKPLARSWLTHFPGICPKKLTILVSWIIIVSCGYRPWDQNCRRTLLTQLTDRFFGRNSPSHGIFSCKRLGFPISSL